MPRTTSTPRPAFSAAIAFAPGMKAALYWRGYMRGKLGRFDEAIADMEQYLATADPKEAERMPQARQAIEVLKRQRQAK